MAVLLAACLSIPAVAWADRKSEVEQQLAELKAQIERIQADIDSAHAAHRREQDALKQLDLDIQDNALTLRELAERRAAHEAEIARIEAERQAFLDSLGQRKAALAEQLVAAYRLGRESRLKLLLSEDDPARLGRMLAYYDHVSDAHAEQIEELRAAIAVLDGLQARTDAALTALSEVESERRAEAQALSQRRERRSAVLASLVAEIGGAEAQLAELRRNRADLEALLEQLSQALADVPSDIDEFRPATALRGALPMPVSGRVMHAFGQHRPGGMAWRGWLISAEAGTEVRSVAYGRVAYADWLRGYGLLMIIDHGDGILSLYGQNESLLFEVGDWVQPGTVIATVGSRGSAGQGAYFELRQGGKAVDPAIWVKRG